MLDVLSCLFLWVSDLQLNYVATPSSEEREQEEKAKFTEPVYGKCVKVQWYLKLNLWERTIRNFLNMLSILQKMEFRIS